MFKIFLFFSALSSGIAIAALGIIIFIFFFFAFPNDRLPMLDELCRYLRYCRISSIVFTICSWLMVSGESMDSNLVFYQQIADRCLLMGTIWILSGFLNIIFSIFFCLTRNSNALLTALNKTRASAFIMGVIFFLLSFILKVS